MANHGRFVWHELLTKDPEAAIAFYGEVIGWKTEPFGDDGYRMWVGSQGPLGGVMTLPDEAAKMGAPPHWMGHVQVDDIDATVARVTELGGKIYVPPTEIPTVGRFSVIADPHYATLSVFQPASEMKLHDPKNEGYFCWNELMSADVESGFAFYAELFGWKKFDDMDMGPMGTYRIYGTEAGPQGGIMNLPPGATFPPAWVYYTETKDIDAAVGRATRNGAQLLHGPADVPGGGKIAQLTDPQGAMFALHQSPPTAG